MTAGPRGPTAGPDLAGPPAPDPRELQRPPGVWSVQYWPDRDEPWRVLRHEDDCDVYVDDYAFPSEREAVAVCAALNSVEPGAAVPAPRGEPSDAQIVAARDAWPADTPLPNDADLARLVRAVNHAPWPDAVSAPPAGLTVERLAALLREYGALVIQGREHDAEKQAAWLLPRLAPVFPEPEAASPRRRGIAK